MIARNLGGGPEGDRARSPRLTGGDESEDPLAAGGDEGLTGSNCAFLFLLGFGFRVFPARPDLE